jgi:hypothetical protein
VIIDGRIDGQKVGDALPVEAALIDPEKGTVPGTVPLFLRGQIGVNDFDVFVLGLSQQNQGSRKKLVGP